LTSSAHSVSKILKHSASIIQKELFLIQNIDDILFQILINRSKQDHTEIFAMFIKDIDREIVYNTQCDLNIISVSFTDKTTQNLKDIKVKLFLKYQNFLDIFNRAQANKLLSHRLYNHKIKLISDVMSSQC